MARPHVPTDVKMGALEENIDGRFDSVGYNDTRFNKLPQQERVENKIKEAEKEVTVKLEKLKNDIKEAEKKVTVWMKIKDFFGAKVDEVRDLDRAKQNLKRYFENPESLDKPKYKPVSRSKAKLEETARTNRESQLETSYLKIESALGKEEVAEIKAKIAEQAKALKESTTLPVLFSPNLRETSASPTGVTGDIPSPNATDNTRSASMVAPIATEIVNGLLNMQEAQSGSKKDSLPAGSRSVPRVGKGGRIV